MDQVTRGDRRHIPFTVQERGADCHRGFVGAKARETSSRIREFAVGVISRDEEETFPTTVCSGMFGWLIFADNFYAGPDPAARTNGRAEGKALRAWPVGPA